MNHHQNVLSSCGCCIWFLGDAKEQAILSFPFKGEGIQLPALLQAS